MMKEYHPNGIIKHSIIYHDNGCKYVENFYDEVGYYHREDYKPDFQSWYNNGMLLRKTYMIHGKYHNISNPTYIMFNSDGKILEKFYYLNNIMITKLNWKNKIKNI